MEEIIHLKAVKRGLLFFLGFIFLAILADQIFLFWQFHRPFEERTAEDSHSADILESSPHESLDTYLAAVSESNLFGLKVQPGLGTLRTVSIDGLIKDIRLKGIAVFDSPEAIVENAKTGKTLFIKKGSRLGEMTVKNVKKDSLTLSYDGEEKELKIESGI